MPSSPAASVATAINKVAYAIGVSATVSGLILLYLARPFITELGGQQAARATVLLFSGAALAGAAAFSTVPVSVISMA